MKCPKCQTDNPDTQKYCGECATSLKPPDIQPPVTKTLITPKDSLLEGSTIGGRYTIIEELGRGGMGVVYKAEDTKLRRSVALKFLPSELTHIPEVRTRFKHEAQAAAALDHPNICTVYEFDQADESSFISMAYIEGQSIRTKIEAGPLGLEEAMRIAEQVAEGLQAAHHKGIVHRDIKSANILVTERGQAKIMDFGLARTAEKTLLTKEGTTMGTVAYMSPEQTRGEEVDQRTDIWSFGVVLYEMLTGRLPFKGEHEQAVVYSIRKDKPRSITEFNAEIPKSIEQVVDKALEKDAAKRYQQVDELLDDLKSISAGIVPEEIKARLRKAKLRRRKRVILYAGAVGLACLALVLALTLFTGPAEAIESIAVLPLENLTGGEEQQYVVDSVMDELIGKLGQISGLKRVISRTSVMQYKETAKSLSDIARELNVDAILEGTVYKVGDSIRVRFQLTEALPEEQNLWGETYERPMRDVLMMYSEVAQVIAQKIRVELTPEEKDELSSTRAINLEALRAYTLGRHVLETEITPVGMKKAMGYFETALEFDPNYAEAYVGLFDAWWSLAWSLLPRAQKEAREEAKQKAREMAQRALEMDSALSKAHAAMATIQFYFDWDWEGAETSFQKALDLNPNDSYVRSAYSGFLYSMLRHDEAIEQAMRAEELDPLSLEAHHWVGESLYAAKRIDQAMQKFLEIQKRDPNHLWSMVMLGHCYWDKGQKETAMKTWGKMHESLGNQELANAFAKLSVSDALHKWLEQEKGDETSPWFNVNISVAGVHALLGEKEEALVWLEKGFREHDINMPMMRGWPGLDILSEEPRYQALVIRMNFPDLE